MPPRYPLSDSPSSPALAVGQIRRHVLQGTVATYRVVADEGENHLVEVIEAPGLRAGMRFRFTTTAVGAMALVAEDAADHGNGSGPLPTTAA